MYMRFVHKPFCFHFKFSKVFTTKIPTLNVCTASNLNEKKPGNTRIILIKSPTPWDLTILLNYFGIVLIVQFSLCNFTFVYYLQHAMMVSLERVAPWFACVRTTQLVTSEQERVLAHLQDGPAHTVRIVRGFIFCCPKGARRNKRKK